ncbi:30S ribosomal protein S5 [Candidatus Woesearchaeota archaeon]|nr:30S ribosomal protein S5 [Candidatus Woesearchaeota archaeon]
MPKKTNKPSSQPQEKTDKKIDNVAPESPASAGTESAAVNLEVAEEALVEVLVTPETEEEILKKIPKKQFDTENWKPKTALGAKVKRGEITDIDAILDEGQQILEPEITEILLPNVESDLLLVGQSKGKFGGGARRVFRQTQKKTMEGNKPSFATYAVLGDRRGHVGVGYGKSRETVPAREKATRNAKLGITKIRRGCGSWQCSCKEAHSIPFMVEGKCGSVIVRLIPAPKGTGLITPSEVAKILQFAGIEDVWSKTFGKTSSRFNLVIATMEALKQLMTTKVQSRDIETLNIKQ